MGAQLFTVIVSVFSVLIASIALGWNIYRDVILKPKVKVSFAIIVVFHELLPHRPQYLNLTATNYGPGIVKTGNICVRQAPLWRRILRKVKFAIINPDYTNPMSTRLPAKIEVGDRIEVFLPYDEKCFLNSPFTDIGLSDYYGRVHWAPRRDLKKAYATWRKDFGGTPA